jgi:hypothetical protein
MVPVTGNMLEVVVEAGFKLGIAINIPRYFITK